jgi:hypothetical protein
MELSHPLIQKKVLQYPFMTRIPDAQTNHIRPALQSMHQCQSPLASLFFSKSNIAHVQVRLREIIQQKTGYTIAPQSENDLSVIMRGIYIEYNTNPPLGASSSTLQHEVNRLNELVLKDIVPMVATNMAQYLGYIKDASSLPPPLERGQATSIKGQKTFQLFRSL